jgi:hypothetical protein
MPNLAIGLEYLYNELKKREQQLASKKAWTHNNSLFSMYPHWMRIPSRNCFAVARGRHALIDCVCA